MAASETPAILVEQPLGSFYIVRLPARLLLEVGFSDVLTAVSTGDDVRPYTLDGTQRELQQKRLTQIGAYIDRDDAAFPNAIILAANIRPKDGLIEEDPGADEALSESPGASVDETDAAKDANRENRRWAIREDKDGRHTLHIPTNAKLAAVIDGQHRLWGFTYAEVLERLDMDLSCAIYMDLPKPFQAQLFATINSNQKRVDKSLTYELFGYNIEDEEPEYWAPDKLAVFLTRRLGADSDSPLQGRISIAPRKDTALEARLTNSDWKVSTAVIVDGILRLLSSNPKRDGNDMVTPHRQTRDVLGAPDQRIDLVSISAHKLQGPKGVGALIARRRRYVSPPLTPLMFGGGHERGLRPGTLPAPLIAAFGEAVRVALDEKEMRDDIAHRRRQALLTAFEPLRPALIGDQDWAVPNILMLAIPGVNSEALMLALRDIAAVSNGAACTSSSYTVSHVLTAMGLPSDLVAGATRFSWGADGPEPDWAGMAQAARGLARTV